MKRILVTGAGGYIGSRVTKQAIELGYEIVAIDDFSAAQVKSIDGTQIQLVDIRNHDAVSEAMAGVDCVMHLAAVSGVEAANTSPSRAIGVNVTGTHNLASFCQNEEVPLIFASSMAVLGKPEAYPIPESHSCVPLNVYGMSKFLAERIVDELSEEAFPSIGFRISNVYGYHDVDSVRVTKASVVQKFVELARNGQPLMVYEPGSQARDFLSVQDVSGAFLQAAQLIMKNPELGLRVVNLASGRWISIRQLAEMVVQTASRVGLEGRRFEIVPNPRGNTETATRRFDVDISLLMDFLQFRPRQSLEDFVGHALAAKIG